MQVPSNHPGVCVTLLDTGSSFILALMGTLNDPIPGEVPVISDGE